MRSRWIAGALVALLLLYVVLVARSAYGLLISGEVLGVAIGVSALAIPVLTVWFLIREIAMARAVDRLAGIMEEEGSLDLDDLPRSPGGGWTAPRPPRTSSPSAPMWRPTRRRGAGGSASRGPTTTPATGVEPVPACAPRCSWSGAAAE